MTADGLVEQLGLPGVFLAGAIPWLEAVTVTPIGILVGLDPLLTFIFATGENILAVILFAYLSKQILHWLSERRERKTGLESRDSRAERARRIFDRYGIIGMGLLGPLVVGTQFAAVAVSFGVSPLKSSVVVSIGATSLGLMAGGVTLGIISL